MPSFDVVSEVDEHELTNAVDQANRELGNRFDFQGTGARFALAAYTVTLTAPSDFQVRQMQDILTQKLAGRGIAPGVMDPGKLEVALHEARLPVEIRHGVDRDAAREIVKRLKESKLKVQAAIQGEQVRVSAKKRDDLQAAIALLKESKLDLPLQFTNFRD